MPVLPAIQLCQHILSANLVALSSYCLLIPGREASQHHPARPQAPPLLWTGFITRSIAHAAVYSHFSTGLCGWEVTRSDRTPSPFGKEIATSSFQATSEMSHSTVLVNQQALDLVERRRVRSINTFIAVYCPRYDD